jgi:hypothetical protein
MGNQQKLGQKTQDVAELMLRLGARRRALAALIRGLRARRSFYDSGSRSTKTEEDFKTQVQAAELLLYFDVGRPVERREIVQMNLDSTESYLDRIRKSPELRKKLAEILADAEKKIVEVGGNKAV